VDVAVIDPRAECHLEQAGSGGFSTAAEHYEHTKRTKYKKNFDSTVARFAPFVVETTGALGPAARKLVHTLATRRTQMRLQRPTNDADE
jgi:hypothetical protein